MTWARPPRTRRPASRGSGALAAELRMLRAHTDRPLPDLVGEVERVLGLDVEVAAQPWRDPAAARADLDAFADAASTFADDQEEPTLGAFLAYLTAAEAEEFGLESRSAERDELRHSDHRARGQGPAVGRGGRARPVRRGEGAGLPARPVASTRWTENPRLLPFSLRGDADDLPALPYLTAESLAAFSDACAARELAEERRLAYVAVTRAAFWVACTGYWWGEGASPLGPSLFLDEIRAACEVGAGTVERWAAGAAEDATNPALAEPVPVPWYAVPGRAAVRGRPRGRGAGRRRPSWRAWRPAGRLSGQDRLLAQAWERDTALLLAEREGGAATPPRRVSLPGRLSVSSLVTMAADPAELARQIRRPMPRPPAPQARRGSAFHQWLEERFGQQRLIDSTDLLGAADEPADDDATRATWRCCGSGSRRESGAAAGRWRWRCRSRR